MTISQPVSANPAKLRGFVPDNIVEKTGTIKRVIVSQDLFLKFAPRRARRLSHVRSLGESADWACSLDWETNEYAFFLLCRSIFDSLDFSLRGRGVRLDQFLSREDFRREARRQVEFYQQERLGGCVCIYRFLYASIAAQLQADVVVEKKDHASWS